MALYFISLWSTSNTYPLSGLCPSTFLPPKLTIFRTHFLLSLINLNTCTECLMFWALCKAWGIPGGVRPSPAFRRTSQRKRLWKVSWIIKSGEGRRGISGPGNSSESGHGLCAQTLDWRVLPESHRRPEEKCFRGNSASLCSVGCLRKTCHVEFFTSSESLLLLPFNSNPECSFSCA